MADSNRRSRRKAKRLHNRQIAIIFIVLSLLLSMVIAVHFFKQTAPPDEIQQSEQHLNDQEELLRKEVEERQAQAAELARRQAEEARLKAEREHIMEEEQKAITDETLKPESTQDQDSTAPSADTANARHDFPQQSETETQTPPPPAPVIDADTAESDERSGEAGSTSATSDPQPPRQNEPDPFDGKTWEQMVEKMVKTKNVEDAWDKAKRKTQSILPALFNNNNFRYTYYHNNKDIVAMVEFCYLAERIGSNRLHHYLTPEKGDGTHGSGFITWLLTDKSRPLHLFLRTFMINNGDPANLSYAIHTLYENWKLTNDNTLRTRYLNLAIACALIHPDIAHKSAAKLPVGKKSPPLPIAGIDGVYQHFLERDRKGNQRYSNIRSLSASALLYVVDMPLPENEYRWADNLKNITREKWGTQYDTIKYDSESSIREDFNSPYKYRSFEDIVRKGGTCRDRAYFTAGTAKCVGIPAAIVTGQGARGPHQWVIYMPNDRSWTQAGAFDYNTGYITNPCSNKMQHESELLTKDKYMTDEKLEPLADALLLAEYMTLCKKPTEAIAASCYATATFPKYVTGWKKRLSLMKQLDKQTKITDDLWIELRNDIERHTGKNTELSDLTLEVEDHYLNNQPENTQERMRLKRMRILEKNYKKLHSPLTGNISLLLNNTERQAKLFLELNDKNSLVSLYRNCFRDHANRGDIFLQLVTQSMEQLPSGDSDYLNRIATEAEKAYSRGAYKGGDILKILMDTKVMLAISDLYFKAANNDKGSSLRNAAKNKQEEIAKLAKRGVLPAGTQKRSDRIELQNKSL